MFPPHSRGRSAVPVPVLALLALVLVVPPVAGQAAARPEPAPAWVSLNRELEAAKREHLRRVAVWGGLNLVAGLALAATAGDGGATRRGFGVQAAAWGAINLGLAAWGFAAAPPTPPVDASGALAAEDGWAHLLLVNLGLNVGYVAVGTTLWVVSGRGLRSGDAVRGHGMAVVVQGAALLALDGVAWAASRGRLDALGEWIGRVGVAGGPLPDALSLGIALPWPS